MDTKENRGIDTPDKRPGVPHEAPPPKGAALIRQAQEKKQRLTVGAGKKLTPVFGTAQPPKGLSGLLRFAAYKIPEQKARHWMMLILADRIDVVESAIGELLRRRRVAFLFAGLVGGFALGLKR